MNGNSRQFSRVTIGLWLCGCLLSLPAHAQSADGAAAASSADTPSGKDIRPTGVSGTGTGAESSPDEASQQDSSGAGPLAGHSLHGEAFNEGPRQSARLMAGTGAVHFPVESTNPDVQAFIDQGVGQLHGFWYFEAERSFRQAAALDPDCAAAYWGMAMANANNRERAQKFIAQAIDRKEHASPRVARYIVALDNLFKAKDAQSGSDAYISALEKIVYDFPDDIEAKAFIALHLWEARNNGQKIRSHLAVDALIGEVLAAEPMHPVHHYRIHLWDYEKPERALASAALCGQSAPAIAHMWHMPGHIYSRLKRYRDAAWQQEASARTDHSQMMRDRLLPDQIHNFAHNNEWLIRDLIFVGRIHDALELAKNMIELPRHPKFNLLSKSGCSASYGRMRLLQVLAEGELWQETLRLSQSPYLEPSDTVTGQAQWLQAVGRAHFRLGHDQQADEVRRQLESLLCQKLGEQLQRGWDARREARKAQKTESDVLSAEKQARRELDGEVRAIQGALLELNAFRAMADGHASQAIRLLEKSKDYDPALLARWRMKAAQSPEDQQAAIDAMRDYVSSHEHETVPLAHLAALQWEAGQADRARQTIEQLRLLSADIDLQAPPFSRLAPIAASVGWPRDWRIDSPPRDDIGQRPTLESLGPFRWQPTQAPDWTLTDASGRTVSLADYRGRPVVLIFYLGSACLHCAQQLQTFGPRTQDFRNAGIELAAISSDDSEQLKNSLAIYDGVIPIPLLSDDALRVFRLYRAFDDFEKRPLHGTFVIDAEGRIRWHDISFEPFMDVEFVLAESRRLLAQSTVAGNKDASPLATTATAKGPDNPSAAKGF
jgi:peroxiredoxin